MTEEPGGFSPWGCKESDMKATNTFMTKKTENTRKIPCHSYLNFCLYVAADIHHKSNILINRKQEK